MTKKYTGQLTSDRVLTKIEMALSKKNQLDAWLRATLDTLPTVLADVSGGDLAEQREALLALRNAADEALSRNDKAQGKLDAMAGHVLELRGAVHGDSVLYELRDVATLIKNEFVFFEAHPPTVRAVLEIVDPAIFAQVFAALPEARQAALLGWANQAGNE